ncbi:MAG: hypothetical protein D6767_01330, partial [Candidatus Hydrogenedentota bacterium]
ELLLLISNNFFRETAEILDYLSIDKTTLSKSMKVLLEKEYIQSIPQEKDRRAKYYSVTRSGKALVREIEKSIHEQVAKLLPSGKPEQLKLYDQILQIVYRGVEANIISLQKMCFTCAYYEHQEKPFCHFLNEPLTLEKLQILCPDHKD